MRRFHIAGEINGNSLSIADVEQLHHLKDVLRLTAGDRVIVFDGIGNECVCLIAELQAKQAILMVTARRATGKGMTKVTIACAIPKKAGMDEVVDSLTQLGVDAIIPMETERVIIRLDDSKKAARLERWRRIARSAAKQSQRSTIPTVEPVTGIERVISGSLDFDLKLIPTLAGERKTIKQVLAGVQPRNILVLIGPEGDFTPQEIDMARNAGFVPISLGDNVLRVATAAISVVGYIRFSVSSP